MKSPIIMMGDFFIVYLLVPIKFTICCYLFQFYPCFLLQVIFNVNIMTIKEIKLSNVVVCFNAETLDTKFIKVVQHYIRETDKQIYKITTLSGREIIATEDNKFMTTEGWSQAKNMIENETKIGILSHQNNLENINTEEKIILTEEQFREFFIKNNFHIKLIDKYVKDLKNINLLPLLNTDYKLPVLSRIFGFILADGSINIYERNNLHFTACSLDFGTEDDVKSFENDIKLCGFNKCKYNKSIRTFNDTTHTTYSVTHNGILPAILLALEISRSKKTETFRNKIPSWIMNGTKLVKREFLSGFQGGDGCKIRWNKIDKGYNFVCAETSQQINPKYVKSLINFMEQCVILLKEFEIEVSNDKQ